LQLALVDLKGAGVRRKAVASLDPSRGAAEITFDNANAETLGKLGEGWQTAGPCARPRRESSSRSNRSGRRYLPRHGEGLRDDTLCLRPPDRLVQAIKHSSPICM